MSDLYLDLLKRSLTGVLFQDEGMRQPTQQIAPFDVGVRWHGADWPAHALTMIGGERLTDLEACLESVIAEKIPGDLMETGVWRGGAVIFMRGFLKARYEIRRVWAADSFQGVPPPDASLFPVDRGVRLCDFPELAVSLEEVTENFRRYGLLDEQVCFLPGWFRDTLPAAPIYQLALLRLDGDLYESTYIALESLYPKLSPGGYVLIDDYHSVPGCRQAVSDFRLRASIVTPLTHVGSSVRWRKEDE